MEYRPAKLPQNPTADDLAAYLEDELQTLASAIMDNILTVDMLASRMAPLRPRTGTIVYADGTNWNPGSGEGLYVYESDNAWHPLLKPQRSYLSGLTLSTAGGSITFGIAVGEATDSTATIRMILGSAFTKTNNGWSFGTAAGALDTGAIAASTWYHVFLIERVDTGHVDVLISLSATAPTLPTGYTLFRRIGSMKTDAGGFWTAFTQIGDEFHWAANVVDVSTANPGTAAVSATLTVPPGVNVVTLFHGGLQSGTVTPGLLFTSLDENDIAPFAATGNNNADMWCAVAGQFVYGSFSRRTNTSAQIRYRVSATSATTTVYVYTYGWIDARGRLE